jgi:hypothetical protein
MFLYTVAKEMLGMSRRTDSRAYSAKCDPRIRTEPTLHLSRVARLGPLASTLLGSLF